ncbi:lactonase family protein [Paucibacter sp. XJ19-41]|uniref:lactonase family protein n=1 Tax=Paucibacter sp. XJ19-41 TaxID=2927824 RepID=UPI00234BB962|nr:beta-propeller fold lactonase family protein [Paucibacter sp. XJ19-41]MDC6167896.1 beta-propeller fold lactonase family protein [Paucibacter sp. XJ19-41]
MLLTNVQRRCAALVFVMLSACGGGGGGGGGGGADSGNAPAITPPPTTIGSYAVGGSVSGLAGGELVVALNGSQLLSIRSDGIFAFPQKLADGTLYSVAVHAHPALPAQTCSITSDLARGQVSGADSRQALIQCGVNHYGIGGTVIGLKGQGLALQLNGTTTLPLASDGDFRFPDQLPSGSTYQVQVKSQPQSPAQTCSLGSGTASGTVVALEIGDLRVQCATNHYAVTVQVAGLTGTGLVLRNNAADDLAVSGNGSATFAAPVSASAGYAVTVLQQPSSPSQACSVVNGVGTAGPSSANVDTVRVVCTDRSFTVAGQIRGLQGSGLVLRNNGGDETVPDRTGRFQFRTPVASGARYAVTVRTQPSNPSQTCTVNADTAVGPVTDADVSGVTVSCSTNAYKVGGVVRGLWAPSLSLQLNGAEDLEVRGDGAFEFKGPLASGSAYRITVKAQPRRPMMNCEVIDGTGAISAADVAAPVVQCEPVGGMFAYYPSIFGGLGMLDMDPATGTFAHSSGNGSISFSSGRDPKGASFSADGALVFAANGDTGVPYSGSLDMVTLDPQTGRLGRMVTEIMNLDRPTGITAHPSGKYAYSPTRNGKIRSFKADPLAGTLKQVGEITSTLWEGRDGIVDPAGRFLYVQSPTGHIEVLRISAVDGTLTWVQTARPFTDPPRMEMKLHPSGRFLYVLQGGVSGIDWLPGSIATMSVDAESGRLTSIGSTGDLGKNSQALALHPSGRYLYVNSAGHFDHGPTMPMVFGSLTAMSIDPVTGLPSRLQPDIDNGFPVASCVSVDVSGRYLYADTLLPDDSRVIRLFRIDAGTGKLRFERNLARNLPCPMYRESGL